MATNKEIKINGVMTPVTDFSHTSQEIDDATTRALEGGAIDQLLAGKAPAGYGLGTDAVPIDDYNNAVKSGWYGGGNNYPSKINYANYGMIRVDCKGQVIFQTFYAGDTGGAMVSPLMAIRKSIDYGATWSEWEYINPQMLPGVEYRTTERYNGKPVYVKAIATGAMPSASGLSNRVKIDTGILTSKVDAIVRWGGTVTNGGTVFTLPTALGVDQVVELSGFTTPYNEYVVYIESSNDKSDYSGTLVFAYTKKAD